jgi:subtilase family serine protease
MHTNYEIFLGDDETPMAGLGPAGGMTPTQIRSFYQMPATGGSNVIAIVDAFHYPNSLNDFNVFSTYFGLPTETSTNVLSSSNKVFQVVYASGSVPPIDGGWSVEMALDIEWAHAMAPGAKIVLVEAASNSNTDLLTAVDVASAIPGVKEISMSWGGGEVSNEQSYDSHFPQNNGIVYFASSGDYGGDVIYPSCSPGVVAVGGTTVTTNTAGVLVSETGWSDAGGGTSLYELKPSYQNGIANTPATYRGVPDCGCDADPNTGVAVYDSYAYEGINGWAVIGGTSVSSPCTAGMVNLGGFNGTGTAAELSHIYGLLGTTGVRDITVGQAGNNHCLVGWDAVTGVGAMLGVSNNISGTVMTSGGLPLSGVVMSCVNSTTAVTDSSGSYTLTVQSNWSGTVTPVLAGYTFTPPSMSYSNLTTSMTQQNYIANAVAPPTIAITYPTSSGSWTTNAQPLAIAGTASAAAGVAITGVTWTNSAGGSGTCIGTTTWSASGIVLKSGTNVITVTATDSTTNQVSATLTVTYIGPPTVTITSPTSSGYWVTSSQTLSIAGSAVPYPGLSVAGLTWTNSMGRRRDTITDGNQCYNRFGDGQHGEYWDSRAERLLIHHRYLANFPS